MRLLKMLWRAFVSWIARGYVDDVIGNLLLRPRRFDGMLFHSGQGYTYWVIVPDIATQATEELAIAGLRAHVERAREGAIYQ